jgi:hypothetical protein
MLFNKQTMAEFCASVSDPAFVGPQYEIKVDPSAPKPAL